MNLKTTIREKFSCPSRQTNEEPRKRIGVSAWECALCRYESSRREAFVCAAVSIPPTAAMKATYIGYDPGVVYYEITYLDACGEEQTSRLATLELAARGVMSRGMQIDPAAVTLYQAAKACAYDAEKKRCWGNEPTNHIG